MSKKYQTMKKAIKMEIKEHRKSFLVYLTLRALVILVMILQIFNRNFENVFLCLLTLILLIVPSFLQGERMIKQNIISSTSTPLVNYILYPIYRIVNLFFKKLKWQYLHLPSVIHFSNFSILMMVLVFKSKWIQRNDLLMICFCSKYVYSLNFFIALFLNLFISLSRFLFLDSSFLRSAI